MDTNMEIFALKDALWKLTARVAVIENVITERFGAGVFSVLPKSSHSFTSVEPQIHRKANNKKKKSVSKNETLSLEPLNEISSKRMRVRNTFYCEEDWTSEGENDASDSQTDSQKATATTIKVEDEDYEPNEDTDDEEVEVDEKEALLFQAQTPLSKSSNDAIRDTGCTSSSEKEERRNQSTSIDSKPSGRKPEKRKPVIDDDDYEYVLRRKKNVKGSRTGGRKKDDIWLSFSRDEKCENPDVDWKCNTCHKKMSGNATRMKKHKMKCDVRQQDVKIKPFQKSKNKPIPAPKDTSQSHNPSQHSDPGQIAISI